MPTRPTHKGIQPKDLPIGPSPFNWGKPKKPETMVPNPDAKPPQPPGRRNGGWPLEQSK